GSKALRQQIDLGQHSLKMGQLNVGPLMPRESFPQWLDYSVELRESDQCYDEERFVFCVVRDTQTKLHILRGRISLARRELGQGPQLGHTNNPLQARHMG